MTSRKRPDEAYVWIWLPGATEPVVAGLLSRDGDRLIFNYGRSYLERDDAIPIYEPELPLRRGAIPPDTGLKLASALRDAAPDACPTGSYDCCSPLGSSLFRAEWVQPAL